mmetsp:Transcript_8934/g.19685  ORF Transcript_8934/g.19685 Transcript_8934/m.19685 type:complete len:285 (-) Transcript_8934:2792-3646(-)
MSRSRRHFQVQEHTLKRQELGFLFRLPPSLGHMAVGRMLTDVKNPHLKRGALRLSLLLDVLVLEVLRTLLVVIGLIREHAVRVEGLAASIYEKELLETQGIWPPATSEDVPQPRGVCKGGYVNGRVCKDADREPSFLEEISQRDDKKIGSTGADPLHIELVAVTMTVNFPLFVPYRLAYAASHKRLKATRHHFLQLILLDISDLRQCNELDLHECEPLLLGALLLLVVVRVLEHYRNFGLNTVGLWEGDQVHRIEVIRRAAPPSSCEGLRRGRPLASDGVPVVL